MILVKFCRFRPIKNLFICVIIVLTNIKVEFKLKKENSLLVKTYLMLSVALCLSGIISYITIHYYYKSLMVMVSKNSILMFFIWIIELVIVIISSKVGYENNMLSIICLVAYSLINGFVLSFTFVYYSFGSIVMAFLSTAITYFISAIIGTITKKDLSNITRIAMIVLVGIIVTSLLNTFIFKSGTFSYVTAIVTIVIMTIFVARDSQQIKQLSMNGYNSIGIACNMALSIYISIINLLLSFLRIFGKRN